MDIPQGLRLALSLVHKEIERLRSLPIVIAVDGHSSSGKSTIAKDLSRLLDYIHIDSGAMYRAVTLYCLDHQIDYNNVDEMVGALDDISISFGTLDDKCHTFLNGIDVEKEIRTMRVSERVSEVATISEVRRHLVTQQRKLRGKGGILMDGRDIGTVVFPDAEVKLFVSASLESRALRRYHELLEKGIKINEEAVKINLEERDFIDSNREDSPLIQADDAIYLDTTEHDRKSQLIKAIQLIAKATRNGHHV